MHRMPKRRFVRRMEGDKTCVPGVQNGEKAQVRIKTSTRQTIGIFWLDYWFRVKISKVNKKETNASTHKTTGH